MYKIKEINIELSEYNDLNSSLIGHLVVNELKELYESGVRINVVFEGQIIETIKKE